MTPEDVRRLADQATPGPWHLDRWANVCDPDGRIVDGLGSRETDGGANARLIALAPDLARLAADIADALDEIHDFHDALAEDFHAKHPESDGEAEDCIVCRIGALLARFRALGETP